MLPAVRWPMAGAVACMGFVVGVRIDRSRYQGLLGDGLTDVCESESTTHIGSNIQTHPDGGGQPPREGLARQQGRGRHGCVAGCAGLRGGCGGGGGVCVCWCVFVCGAVVGVAVAKQAKQRVQYYSRRQTIPAPVLDPASSGGAHPFHLNHPASMGSDLTINPTSTASA